MRKALSVTVVTGVVFSVAELFRERWDHALISGVVAGIVIGVITLLLSPLFDIAAGADVKETQAPAKNQGP